MKPLGPSQELISRIHHLEDFVKNLLEVLPLEPSTEQYNFFVDNDKITEYGSLGAFSKCMEACFETYKHRGGMIEFTEQGQWLESDRARLHCEAGRNQKSKRSRGVPVWAAAIVEPIVISTDSEHTTETKSPASNQYRQMLPPQHALKQTTLVSVWKPLQEKDLQSNSDNDVNHAQHVKLVIFFSYYFIRNTIKVSGSIFGKAVPLAAAAELK
ncbi:hypothetical protein BDQ17DRAFT_1337825 [Cyathus striatus]|nr:hypothetical protein BDQ17DRAFT_1337825 [Cyathus striatus]